MLGITLYLTTGGNKMNKTEIAIDTLVVLKNNNVACILNIVGPDSDLEYSMN